MSIRKFDPILLAIICVFVVLALCYSYATRLKYGPDEPAHFIYIRSLATNFSPPQIAHTETPTEESTLSHEGHQPPLYYAVMAVPYAIMNAFGAPTDTIWRALRLLNIPLGVVWIYLAYLLSMVFFNKRSYALISTAFVALIPTASYMAGVINNENMITLLFTWALIPILAYFKAGKMPVRTAVITGVLIGLAILAKAQGMVLIPAFLVAALLVCRRQHYANYKDVLQSVFIVMGIAGIVSGWWFVRSFMLYGTAMPHSLYNPVLTNGIIGLIFNPLPVLGATWSITTFLYSYFWAPYWLLQPYVAWSSYINTLWILTIITIIGFVIKLRRKEDVDSPSLGFLFFIVGILYLLYVRYVLVVDFMANQQGRLFLPVAVVAGIVFALGFDGLFKSSKAKKIGGAIGLIFMVLVNIAMIGCTLMMYSGNA